MFFVWSDESYTWAVQGLVKTYTYYGASTINWSIDFPIWSELVTIGNLDNTDIVGNNAEYFPNLMKMTIGSGGTT